MTALAFPGINAGIFKQTVGYTMINFLKRFSWLSKMRIGTKLTLSFVMGLGMTLLLTGFGIFNLATVNRTSSELATKWMPGVGHTTTMRASILEFREFEVKHTRAEDTSYMAEYEDKMKDALKVVNDQLGGYEKLVVDTEEKKTVGVLQEVVGKLSGRQQDRHWLKSCQQPERSPRNQ